MDFIDFIIKIRSFPNYDHETILISPNRNNKEIFIEHYFKILTEYFHGTFIFIYDFFVIEMLISLHIQNQVVIIKSHSKTIY
jgi:hypothetical protein